MNSDANFAAIAVQSNMLSKEQESYIWQIKQQNPLLSFAQICIQQKLLSVSQVSTIQQMQRGSNKQVNQTTLPQPLRQEINITEHFGAYRIIEEVARGGMGIVFKAQKDGSDSIVALKVMRQFDSQDEEQCKRFEKEIKLTSRLQHPGIVRVYDSGKIENVYFYTMEFVEGRDLASYKKDKEVPLKKAVQIVEKVSRAMHHAHIKKIIHRDLKPANIIIDNKGNPHVTDLGLAKDIASTSHLTKSGASMGTPHYMAPEQVEGKLKAMGPATDIYALGIILYELLTKQLPYKATSLSNLYHKILNEEPSEPCKLNSSISKGLETIVLKAIAKDPQARYLSAKTFADDLKRFYSGKKVKAKRKSSANRYVQMMRKQGPWPFIVLVLVLYMIIQTETSGREEKTNKPVTKTTSKEKSSLSQQKKPASPAKSEFTKSNSTKKSLAQTKKKSHSKKQKNKKRWQDGPGEWPVALWKECWNPQGKWLDFTKSAWLKVPRKQQKLYSRKYQKWYTAQMRIAIASVCVIRNQKKYEARIVLRFVPPGKFWMGSPPKEPHRDLDEVRHKVLIKRPYYIGQYEVTQKQWQLAFKNKAYFKAAGKKAPIEMVSALTAKEYCKRTRFRLPTEAEWEYAARAGTTSTTYQSHLRKPCKPLEKLPTLSKIAWYCGDSKVNYRNGFNIAVIGKKTVKLNYRQGTHPVGQKKENSWGLFDMIGNVWEWCSDFYGPYSAKSKGPASGNAYVARGGSWYSMASECRAANRKVIFHEGKTSKSVSNFTTGFRVCASLKQMLKISPGIMQNK